MVIYIYFHVHTKNVHTRGAELLQQEESDFYFHAKTCGFVDYLSILGFCSVYNPILLSNRLVRFRHTLWVWATTWEVGIGWETSPTLPELSFAVNTHSKKHPLEIKKKKNIPSKTLKLIYNIGY